MAEKRPFHLLFNLLLIFSLGLTIGMSRVSHAQDSNDQDVTVQSDAEPAVDLEFMNKGTVPTSLDQLRAMEDRVAEIFEDVKSATVNIQMEGTQGSGVVVSRDGYILTAAHVITGPHRKVTITFPDGSTAFAKTFGVNPGVDSGMLKIIGKKKWPYVDLGESESLTNGQWVVAIGHPGGVDMKRGLVVRVGRIIYKSGRILRTDCTLVGGDSGGPLFDMEGNLIGIHSRIGNSLNDNIHVPADAFSDEWDQLARGEIIGRPSKPFIGIKVVDESNLVDSVNPGSPADEAGIRIGDTIIKINEKKVTKKSEMGTAFRKLKPGDEITITIKRIVTEDDQAKTEENKDAAKDKGDGENEGDDEGEDEGDQDDSADEKQSTDNDEKDNDDDKEKKKNTGKEKPDSETEITLKLTVGRK